MEFADVVMKRRAVRRFEEGGVDREVIERIARLAQRTPSAGFSQGQRLVVVTDRPRGARSRGSAARSGTRPTSGRGSASAPPSSSRASARRSTTAATRSRTRSTRTAARSSGRSRTGGSTSARRCRTSCWRPWTRASAAASSGRDIEPAPRLPRHPGRVRADRRHAGRAAAAGRPVTQPQARLGAVRASSPAGSAGAERWRPQRGGGHDPGGGSTRPSPQASGPQKSPFGGGAPAGPAAASTDRRATPRASRPARPRSRGTPSSAERPAGLEADPLERALGEHDVAVARRIAVALAVADEHDPPAGRPMGQHPVALARPAHEAARMAVREGDRRAAPGERRPGGHDGQLRHAERVQRRLDEEAEPVRHDLDRDAGRLRAPDERHEPRVVRLRGGRREQRRRVRRRPGAISQVISRREPISPAS